MDRLGACLCSAQRGDLFNAVFQGRVTNLSYIVAKNPPVGTQEFISRAWDAANEKARELGWIV